MVLGGAGHAEALQADPAPVAGVAQRPEEGDVAGLRWAMEEARQAMRRMHPAALADAVEGERLRIRGEIE